MIFATRKTDFKGKKRFFVKLNDLLQAIKCPLDHQIHLIFLFFNFNTLTKPRKQDIRGFKHFADRSIFKVFRGYFLFFE